MGLVVHDDQSFFGKVVNAGMDEGILTQDRAGEIIRISVAMANKYVLQKEVDFRSTEELARVQETILKLIGVGLEIRAKSDVEEGLRLLLDVSPVELFRLAHTRIERLRHRWGQLLANHRVEILVSSQEYECLNDLTCQRLAQMSVFTESEIYTIRSLTLGDELFSSLGLLEYYENELDRYEFILRLRKILPFGMLNRSPMVSAENLAEVDSIREALINTLIISACLDAEDPVSVSIADVRHFLSELDLSDEDLLPQDMEDACLDIIHELGEGLDESEVSLLTREMIGCAQKLLQIIAGEWDTISSTSETTFFKRWSRLVALSDVPDPISRILSSEGVMDEFEFEMLLEQILTRQETDVLALIERFPWARLTPAQVVKLFHEVRSYQEALAEGIVLKGFASGDLVDLLDGMDPSPLKKMTPVLEEAFGGVKFPLDELEIIAALPHAEAVSLLRMAGPPAEMDDRQILLDFREGSGRLRRVLFLSCWGSPVFHDLVLEAWALDPDFVKHQIKSVQPAEIGSFLASAAGRDKPKVVISDKKEPELRFKSKSLSSIFRSLPVTKKRAAVKHFSKDSRPPAH